MRRILLVSCVFFLVACGDSTTGGDGQADAGVGDGVVEADGGDGVIGSDGGDGVIGSDGGDGVVEPECKESDAAEVCDDENPCTEDGCEDGLCVNAPVDGDCDDGDACTEGDSCQGGACTAGEAIECGDDDECTIDSCDSADGCRHYGMVTQLCRPNIVVDYPPRAAGLIWEDPENPTITVTGSVISGAGHITEFTLNGEDVSLEDDGSFSVEFTPTVGGNTLEFDAKDSTASMRKRVQSFHWALSYLDPKEETVDVPCEGEAVEGVCLQAHLDEGGLFWGAADEQCQEGGGHLAVITSGAQNEAANAQRQAICGDENAWIGMNDNIKEGNYMWVDGTKADGSTEPTPVLATISGVSGEPIHGKAAGAAGLDEGGGALQDGAVGGSLGDGVYLTNDVGGLGSDYIASGEPVILDYDFGGTVSVSSFLVGLYDYTDGAGHPHSATQFSIDLGTTEGASDVAAGIMVAANINGAAGQLLGLGGTFEAAFARVTILDNGYDEASGGLDPAGGDRVGMSEAAFDANFIYANWAEGEPNDWEGDEDVIGMTASGQWNDFNGDLSLSCYICTAPTQEIQYTGHADPGMGIYLDAELIDDGDHSMPPNDLATIIEIVFGQFDLAKIIPNPAASDLEVSGATYDLYITDVTNDKPTVGLAAIEGGWIITADIKNVSAGIYAPKTAGGGFLIPNEITGTLDFETINIVADVIFGVTPEHELDAWVENPTVAIEGVSVDIDGWLGGIIEGALEDSLDSLIDDVETTIGQELGDALAPMLIDALGSLAFGFDFELPSLSPAAAPVQMHVATDFSSVDFGTEGELLSLRSLAVPSETLVTYESKGAPAREGCGLVEQALVVLGEAPMEIIMNDDTVNMILYSAWRGGFLDFDLPPELLADVDLEAFGVLDLEAKVSGLLAPAVSDCKDGQLLLHIGDVMITATMQFLGKPLDMEAYASFDAVFEITAADGKISFGVSDVGNVKLELTAMQDDQIEMEDVLTLLIKDNLMPALTDGLSGDALGGLDLPNIEVDAAGESVEIGIEPLWVQRENGNSIVGAKLASTEPATDDLAEGDLTNWSSGCEDGCASEILSDPDLAVVGEVAVLVETDADGELWVAVDAPAGAPWSLNPEGSLSLLVRTNNPNPEGWEINDDVYFPLLELHDAEGKKRLLWPSSDMLSPSQDTWIELTVPLAGDGEWTVDDEEVDLTSITRVEFHMDTTESEPYSVWFDGVVLPIADGP